MDLARLTCPVRTNAFARFHAAFGYSCCRLAAAGDVPEPVSRGPAQTRSDRARVNSGGTNARPGTLDFRRRRPSLARGRNERSHRRAVEEEHLRAFSGESTLPARRPHAALPLFADHFSRI